MSTSIFIKTWAGDLEWLKYCLESIRKYAIGIDEVVIAADRSCINKMNGIVSGKEKVFYFKDWENGYVQQQWVKLHADQYTTSENVLFVDSDCVFFDYFSENSFMVGRKPILLKTRYGNLEGAEAWRPITEKAMGGTVEWEYMRRLPTMFRRETLTAFRNAFINTVKSLETMTSKSFSEFNCLGVFIERYDPGGYFISDTAEWMHETVARQFWSWGNISSEIRAEIEQFIAGPVEPGKTLNKMRSRDDFGFVLDAMGLTQVGVEIGVAFGENAEQILSKSSLNSLILVDPWNYVPGESPEGYGDMIKDWQGCYKYCHEKLERFIDRTFFWRMTSEQAASQVSNERLDFAYIDANHMSPMIDRDLELWYPKVRKGGIFGGHDYHDYQNSVYTCNVKSAVDRFFSGSDKQIHVVPGEVPSWYVIK